MDRRSSQRPARSYLSRREQWRLLLLVFSLGLVLYLMRQAADPQMWAWLWGGKTQSTPATAKNPKGTGKPHAANGPHGMPSDVDEDRPSASAADSLRPRAPSPEAPDVVRVAPAGASLVPEKHYFPGVDPRLLRAVRDDTVFFSPEEQRAWFHLVDVLRQADASSLEAASVGNVTWRQLFDQPAAYRGDLVTVAGLARRVTVEQPRSPAATVARYYKVWLQPSDHPTSPMIVYCLELPDGFPVGDEIKQPVAVTGFFFKRTAYKAHDRIWLAPLLVAKTLSWRPTAAVSEPQTRVPFWAVVLAAAIIGLGLAWLMWRRAAQGSRLSSYATGRSAPTVQNNHAIADHLATMDRATATVEDNALASAQHATHRETERTETPPRDPASLRSDGDQPQEPRTDEAGEGANDRLRPE